jgi:regulator of ribonuclease activity A
MTATSDILDAHPEAARACELELRQFGGRAAFEGPIATVRCFEDNVLLKQLLGEPGEGACSSSTAVARDGRRCSGT